MRVYNIMECNSTPAQWLLPIYNYDCMESFCWYCMNNFVNLRIIHVLHVTVCVREYRFVYYKLTGAAEQVQRSPNQPT